jgi:PAS domain S-box-containing protein
MSKLQDNDEDIGALGSILSWEDDEEGNQSMNAISAALREKESASSETSSVPPDTVQFSSRDGQFNFYSNGFSTASETSNSGNPLHLQTLSSENKGGALTMQLPMPTRVANFAQNQEQSPQLRSHPSNANQQIAQSNTQYQLDSSQHPENTMSQCRPQQGSNNSANLNQSQGLTAASFAQLLAQQGRSFMQQQSQSVQNQQFIQPNHQNANDAVQQNGQQSQKMQYADPSAFLQQLQIAQLQQQLQVAHQQALQTQQSNQQPQASLSSDNQHQIGQYPQKQTQGAYPAPVSRTLAQQPSNPAQSYGVNQASVQQGSGSNQQMLLSQPNSQVSFQVPASRSTAAPELASATNIAKPPMKKKSRVSGKEAMPSTSSTTQSTLDGVVSASDTEESSKRKDRSMSVVGKRLKTEPIDTSNMTTEQKARANRDRNREHAKNTRMRKKAFLEELKTTVDDLCQERDTLVSERTCAASVMVEMHNTRTEVLMSFFALRSTNEKRRELWASILDESCFTCAVPVTPYRSFPASEVQASKCQRTILGIDGMIADTASINVLFDSIVDRKKYPEGKIEFRYTLVTEEAVVAGNQMMARWVMTTTNAVQCGAKMEVAKQGMLCCKFNSAHKIIGLELMFDVMAFMLQLKHTVGSDGFSVVPNTVQTCQRAFDTPIMMILADSPYTIVQVNKLWEEMTGYTAEEVVGKVGLAKLQCPRTDERTLQGLMHEIRFKRPSASKLLHSKKNGDTFMNFLVAYPLSTDSRITHYLIVTEHTGWPSLKTAGKGTLTGSIPMPSRQSTTSSIASSSDTNFSGTTSINCTPSPNAAPSMSPSFFTSLQQNQTNPVAVAGLLSTSSLSEGISNKSE